MSTQITPDNFQEIYNASYSQVLRYIVCKCSNMDDVNDLIQDTYLEFYNILKRKGMIKLDNYTNYIIGIANKKLKKHYGLLYRLKINSLYENSNDEEYEIEIPSNFDIEQNTLDKIEIDELWKLLKLKDIKIFKVFYLFYNEEYKIVDIAKELNLSQSNVKNIIYRTLQELRNKVKIEGDADV